MFALLKCRLLPLTPGLRRVSFTTHEGEDVSVLVAERDTTILTAAIGWQPGQTVDGFLHVKILADLSDIPERRPILLPAPIEGTDRIVVAACVADMICSQSENSSC